MRSYSARLLRVPLLLATALALFLGLSQPAQAVEILARGDACGAGACGSATFTFTGRYRLTSMSMSVKDTACDSNDVYVHVRIYDAHGSTDTTKRRNSSGCQAGYARWGGLSWNNSRGAINGVRVRVCVDDAGSDTCYTSRYIDNPNT